ncbi:septum site-determining protein MinC [Arenimonas sp.]|jgi:septum site-determining protein MinC|uniref:septum site-determining protein MinC n=1 Tax=Arenimonas sp. TaxID=1872635 RepID=UPI0037BE67C3
MAGTMASYEQCGELKFGQVGIANLRIRTLDIVALKNEMHERVERAPKLFRHAAVILDFSALPGCPDAETADALIDALRNAGVMPVAIAYGTPAVEKLAEQVGLPILAKFRASFERDDSPEPTRPTPVSEDTSMPAATSPAILPGLEPGLLQTQPLRSGQQVYAAGRDLTVCAMVGAGAEAIADGSIHIYGPLRGRALAGASGNAQARIFCREFNAELVAIAGTYKVLDEIPKKLLGKAVQIWLDKDQIRIEELA